MDKIEELNRKNAVKAPINLNKNSKQPSDAGIVQPSTSSKTDDVYVAHNAIACSITEASSDWLLDTCTSYHMTSDRGAFATYETIPNTRSIKDANGGLGPIAGKGTIILQIGDGVLTLKEARHVPTLQSNLVSYAQLEDQGFDLSLSSGVTPKNHVIRSPDGDEFFAYKTHLNVYTLTDCTPTPRQDSEVVYSTVEWNDIGSTACALATIDTPIPTRKRHEVVPQTMTISQWHQRLCHLNQWDIIRLSKDPATGYESKDTILRILPERQADSQLPQSTSTPCHPSHNLDISGGGGKTLGVPDDEELLPSRTGCRYFFNDY